MKKSFLLFMAGAIAATANAQQLQQGVVFNRANDQLAQSSSSLKVGSVTSPSNSSAKVARTTTVCTSCGRWYDYADSIFNTVTAASMANATGNTTLDIWNDTTAIFGYTSGTAYANTDFTSVGLLLDPFANVWNTPDNGFTNSEIVITGANPYTVDSINIGGAYSRNLAKPNVVDTLIVQFVSGNATGSSNLAGYLNYSDATLLSNYGITSGDLSFVVMYHDSLHDRAGISGGALAVPWPAPLPATSGTYKFLLNVNDTISVGTIGANSGWGTFNKSYPRPGHIPADPTISFPVGAGNMVAASVTFKSGDPALSAYPADTVRSSTLVYKYNSWSPFLDFETNGSTGANFPIYYGGSDLTSGYFKEEGARDDGNGGIYLPNWAWSTGTGATASALQYPWISYHVLCPGCLTVGTGSLGVQNVAATNTVKAYPNPATSELNISYTLVNSSVVSVTLTNMLGQVVATQKMENASTGNAVFNTTAIPDGMYIYTLDANGERSTGRVSVAH